MPGGLLQSDLQGESGGSRGSEGPVGTPQAGREIADDVEADGVGVRGPWGGDEGHVAQELVLPGHHGAALGLWGTPSVHGRPRPLSTARHVPVF